VEDGHLPAGFAGRHRSTARSASAAATATAAAPFAAKPAAAAAGTESTLAFGFGPGFINGELAPAEIFAIEVSNCFRGCFVIGDLHKGKTA
jgi:hypothetical protein